MMNTVARTPSKVKELKQKATNKSQITSNVIPQNIVMPFKVEDHLIKEKRMVGKSKGASGKRNVKSWGRYNIESLKKYWSWREQEYRSKRGTVSFNKPQLIGKIYTDPGGERWRIISKF